MLRRDFILDQKNYLFIEDVARDYPMPDPHYHNYYEIYFLVYGRCNFSVEDHLFQLKRNDMLIIPPGLTHCGCEYPEMSRRVIINFSKDCVDNEFNEKLSAFRSNNFYIPQDPTHVYNIIGDMTKEYIGIDSLSKRLQYCHLTLLLEYIIRNKTRTQYVPSQNRVIQTTESFMKFVTDNYAEDISIADLSKQFGYSANYISKLFKDNLGMGFNQYLTLQRIKSAEYMLSTTSTPICEIAVVCGFNDSNYFSTVFKKLHGISPSKYRSIRQKNL